MLFLKTYLIEKTGPSKSYQNGNNDSGGINQKQSFDWWFKLMEEILYILDSLRIDLDSWLGHLSDNQLSGRSILVYTINLLYTWARWF